MSRSHSDTPLHGVFYALVLLLPVLGAGNFPWFPGAKGAQLLYQAFALLFWGAVTLKQPAVFRPLKPQRILWPLVLFVAWAILALPFAKPFDAAWRSVFSLLGFLALPLSALALRLDAQARRRALLALLGGAFAGALYAIYQVYVYFPGLIDLPGLSADDMVLVRAMQRPFGFFPGANVFAGFLAFVLPIGAYLVGSASRKRERILLALALLPIGYALLLTYSRAAFLAALFGLCATAAIFIGARLKRVALGLFAALALGCLLLALFSAKFGDFAAPVMSEIAPGIAKSRGEERKVSVAARGLYWRSALAMGADTFPAGGGPGSFPERIRVHQETTSYTRSPHNIFLRLFAESGIVGLGAFVWLLAALGFGLWRGSKEYAPRERAFMATALGVALLHASLDIDFDLPGSFGLFWLLWALAALPLLAPPVPLTKRQQNGESVRRTLTATLCVPVVFIAQFFPYLADSYGELADTANASSSGDKALELAQTSVNWWPMSPAAHYRLSRLYLDRSAISGSRGDIDHAYASAARARELAPDSPEYALGLADVISAQGENARTLATLKEASDLYPASLYYLTQYVKALSYSGRQQEALHIISRAIEKLEPAYLTYYSPGGMDLIEAHFLRAAILNDRKDFAQAKREYQSMLVLLDHPGLVLQSYASARQKAPDTKTLRGVINEYIARIDEGRTEPVKMPTQEELDRARTGHPNPGMQTPTPGIGPRIPTPTP